MKYKIPSGWLFVSPRWFCHLVMSIFVSTRLLINSPCREIEKSAIRQKNAFNRHNSMTRSNEITNCPGDIKTCNDDIKFVWTRSSLVHTDISPVLYVLLIVWYRWQLDCFYQIVQDNKNGIGRSSSKLHWWPFVAGNSPHKGPVLRKVYHIHLSHHEQIDTLSNSQKAGI